MIDNNTELLKLDGNLTSGNVDVQHVVWVIYWKHTVTHCHGQGHWLRIDLICMFLMIKNTEHPQETHSKTWSTSKHRRAAPQLRCEPRSFLCEATVLTTAPTGHILFTFTFLAESQQRGQPHKRVGSCLFVPSDEAVICALCEQQSSSLSLHADTGWDLLWSSTVSSNFEKSFRRSSKSSIKTVELGVHLSSSSSSMCHRINQTNMGLMIKNRSSEVHCSSFRVLGASICTEDVLEHNWKWKSKWKIRCKLNKIIILPQIVKKKKKNCKGNLKC